MPQLCSLGAALCAGGGDAGGVAVSGRCVEPERAWQAYLEACCRIQPSVSSVLRAWRVVFATCAEAMVNAGKAAAKANLDVSMCVQLFFAC